MKVSELIEKLKGLDQNAIVLYSGYEGGYGEVNTVLDCEVLLNVNDAWYYGPHELKYHGTCTNLYIDQSKYKTTSGVYIG